MSLTPRFHLDNPKEGDEMDPCVKDIFAKHIFKAIKTKSVNCTHQTHRWKAIMLMTGQFQPKLATLDDKVGG